MSESVDSTKARSIVEVFVGYKDWNEEVRRVNNEHS